MYCANIGRNNMSLLFRIISKNGLFVVILLVACALRFIGTNPGYNQFHADEGITYSAATSMIVNKNLDPLRYDYPALVPLINSFFYRMFFIPLSWFFYYAKNIGGIIDGVVDLTPTADEYRRVFSIEILGERYRNALFWGRYVTAFFSIGNVILVYFLGKKIFNKNVGLVAMALLAFNYKHVINSHIGLPDVYNAFFVLLVVYFSFFLWRRPTRANYLIAGILFGLSFSVKYQFFSLLPILLVHLYVSFEKGRFKLGRFINVDLVITGLVAFLVFVLINPYHLIYLPRTIEIVRGVSEKYGMGVKSLNIYPFSYLYHIDYGFLEFVLVFIGIFWAFFAYKKKTLILLSYATAFMFVMVYYSKGGFYVRNFITVTPIFMLFSSFVLVRIYDLLILKLGRRISNIIFILIFLIVVFIPGKNAVVNSVSYTRPWGYDLMRPWIDKYLPKDVVVAAHPFDAVNLGIKNKRLEFERMGNYSLAEHRDAGVDWAIINLNWAGDSFYFWMSYGIDELNLFWNKPVEIMRNTFHGLAAEEMFRYMVYFVNKPWQAPDTHLIVIKMPSWPNVDMRILEKYEFNDDMLMWVQNGYILSEEILFKYDSMIGRGRKGSLVFEPIGSKYPDARLTSPVISIKPGHLYKVSAFMKTDKTLTTREREGFIRVDFYKDKSDLGSVGDIAAVSSRVYGTNDWIEKTIIERAPENVNFMTVSFQTYIFTRTKIWLDDVIVEESVDPIPDITNEEPYRIEPVDLNYLYPNSHGNL